MVYSTCTLNPDENHGVVARFLDNNADFEPAEIFPEIKRSIDEPQNCLTLITGKNPCDGFFISALSRLIMDKIDIKSMSLEELSESFKRDGLKAFRAAQVYEWLTKGSRKL